MADRKSRKPKPRRSRNGFLDVINAMLTLLVLGMLVVGGVFLYGAHSFYAPGPIKADTNFLVERGSGVTQISQGLENQGLISNRLIFQLGSWALKKKGAIKAGEYRLTANSSMADVLNEITEGKPILYGITIPEGYTSWQVVSKLNEDTRLTGGIASLPPEGSVLPDTYNYDPGVTRQSVLDQMMAAQKKAVAQVWANHDPSLPVKTSDQLVVLASIVEKETGIATERGRVAAVFANRLRKNMRLQSDPTIIYGITKGQGTLGRDLKRSEIEAATPFNTYQVDGLPPTPIANPGIDALKATANPDKTNDIYFVAAGAKPSDGHLFAATYADHRKNVAKYRAIQREQNAAAAQADASAADAAKDAIEATQAKDAGDTTAPAK
ncbi:MAG TPA: endolytic transglycosylase MltG [Arsenicitalea sp.]|jgi:UPF0755 protein|nr:endolytic transglycosylase MltG [Arsenicitalea sp.]